MLTLNYSHIPPSARVSYRIDMHRIDTGNALGAWSAASIRLNNKKAQDSRDEDQ